MGESVCDSRVVAHQRGQEDWLICGASYVPNKSRLSEDVMDQVLQLTKFSALMSSFLKRKKSRVKAELTVEYQ